MILEEEDLEAPPLPLRKVQEMIAGPHIGIKDSITNGRYLRELIAHVLGHHYFLHVGNQLFSLKRSDRQPTRSQDSEAQEFAFDLLVR